MSVIIVLAYVLTRTRAYSYIMIRKEITLKQQAGLILIFGILSIYGTLSGINVMGAIANIRDLGPAIAGLIGGPWAGVGAGLIGGIHRYTMGGVTYIPCSISTVVAGLAGGLIHQYRKGKFISISGAVVFMTLVEAFHMGLSLLLVRPLSVILPIIESVIFPMIFTNALGMGTFAFIVRNLMRERETQRTKELIESELSVAREIQMSIVPKLFPAFPDRSEFDIFAVLEPAKEVGGDLYDFFLLDDDHLCFTIGDVSGKGVSASLFMAVTKTLIKAKADIKLGPDEILYQVNNELCADNDSGMFVTEFLGILTISSGDMVFSNGGHNIPFLLRKNGEVKALPKIPGMALGVMEDAGYVCAGVKLEAGDSLAMYTDGEQPDQKQTGKNQPDQPDYKQQEYHLKNKLDEISTLAQTIENFAAENNLPEQSIFQVNLCLDELLTNIINYGFPEGGEHDITVEIALQDETLVVVTHDAGVAFNPLDRPEPDTSQSVEERPIGGLGIHLVRKMMDEVEYRREENQNVLVMKKLIKL